MRILKLVCVVGWTMIGLGCPSAGYQENTSAGMTEEQAAAEPALTSEQLEEINRTFQVGQDAMTACYEQEMERQGKKISCKVMVKLVIGVNGAAEQVEIGENNINSPQFTQCIIKTVKSWEFPRIPKTTPYSFPFAFSPAY